MSLIDRINDLSWIYMCVQRIIGATRAREICIREYGEIRDGQRILDVGCGPAYVLNWLPNTNYLGVDINPNAIRSARAFYRHRPDTSFVCGVFDSALAVQIGSVDHVLLMGILHHLSDDEAHLLLRDIQSILKPGGRIITLDPCLEINLPRLHRWIVSFDRGRFLRSRSQYLELMGAVFPRINSYFRTDLMTIPYPGFVMQVSAE